MMKAVHFLHGGMKSATGRGAAGEISVARFAVVYFVRFLGVLILLTFLDVYGKLKRYARKAKR